MHDKSTRIVAKWIFAGVVMLIVQVLLGGITRLTGSGLSITEWKPIMGALPPSSEAEWQQLFFKYQQIAQYKYLNQHFTLTDFKFIFFWEWFHRLWARLIGVAFIIPFIYFLAKKYIKRWMVGPLINLFLLGALQGAIGWIMVQSGLNENDLYVSHIRLAAHFIAAMILIAYALIFGLKLVAKPENYVVSPALRNLLITIVFLLTIQLIYGAFMAGTKAANVAPTWPDINGALVPGSLLSHGTFLNDIVHNTITIHFVHRTLAYVIFVLIAVWWWKSRKVAASFAYNKVRNSGMFLVLLQVLLGIFTVLNSSKIVRGKFGIFEWTAQLHQLTGMLLLLSMVAALYFTRGKNRYNKEPVAG